MSEPPVPPEPPALPATSITIRLPGGAPRADDEGVYLSALREALEAPPSVPLQPEPEVSTQVFRNGMLRFGITMRGFTIAPPPGMCGSCGQTLQQCGGRAAQERRREARGLGGALTGAISCRRIRGRVRLRGPGHLEFLDSIPQGVTYRHIGGSIIHAGGAGGP